MGKNKKIIVKPKRFVKIRGIIDKNIKRNIYRVDIMLGIDGTMKVSVDNVEKYYGTSYRIADQIYKKYCAEMEEQMK